MAFRNLVFRVSQMVVDAVVKASLGLSVGEFGDTILGLRFGVVGMTFNASGEATLLHGLNGITPSVVMANHSSGGTHILLYPKAGTVGSTGSCVIQARRTDGTAYTASLSEVRWLVIG